MTAVTENDLLRAIQDAMLPRYDPRVHVIATDIAKLRHVSVDSALKILKRLADEDDSLVLEEVVLPSNRTGWALRKK